MNSEEKFNLGNQLFPIFLKLNQLHTVLIGAGFIGLEKLTAIIGNSQLAKVTVIARTFLPEIKLLALENEGINLIEKSFEPADIDHAQLVIAATNDNELNETIVQAAHKRNLLVNIADKPALCDFYLGSIVQKGDLKLAISTNGKSPTVAKRLKEVLNDSIPDEIDATLQQVAELRKTLTGDFANKVKKLNEITAVLIEKNLNREAEQADKLAGEIS
jgi:siroheme synthase-like protein